MIPLSWIFFLSLSLFTIGIFGVLARRNLLFILISLELMLNAVVLLFIAGSRYHPTSIANSDGQIMYILILTLAASEIAIGLSLVIHMYRQHHHLDIDKLNQLRD
ncbi:NADH-quinone oxidoreductase subunit NuoK [Pseudoalteromonas denitrificans]|jgi:NADH-quinone oxidoreductase subunit K|uniref:NADH-quinone oxidoreductase subunit K n=1 Tax=Pseudoalteromonas denitrificans DSM 6059 TaxID=1123010 RepID=A0A1I1P2Y3_9GAMM|nr:NADH-quinone oxidoreductase subunit NuoK [Pseudoalteromonas denitrificans]SFD04291.1 NADH dehydrogenase subunit K [Pseudoalteromonas denitrificans DSM 6059]